MMAELHETPCDRVQEIVAASWEALVHPEPYGLEPDMSIRDLLVRVDDCWMDDRAAWRLSSGLLDYAQQRRRDDLETAHVGRNAIAYANVLAVYKAVRSQLQHAA